MLDLKRIRENPEEIAQRIGRRGQIFDFTSLLEKDAQKRSLISVSESLKARRNSVSKQIPLLKKKGQDPAPLFMEMKQVGQQIKELDMQIAELDNAIREDLLNIPNIPDASVPDGLSDADNVEVRRFMEPSTFSFAPKAHWAIGEDLHILDFEAAAAVAGARFVFYRGLGSRLERSVFNFMLDTHTKNGKYTEIFPPFIVHERALFGTGQFPKFIGDSFKLEGKEYYLIPTAEVPVINMYRERILNGADLPICHAAYSACFRSEAGSAGRDTRGIIRLHQFNKVELVKFVRPESSYDALEALTNDAEKILRLLKLPYHVMALSTGDLGFTSAKTYDLEVWMPSYNRYVEISSCSNCEDFQARRANIRFKDDVKDKAEFVHTLNGSGLAVGRTVAAILENYQQADGSVRVPEVLIPYMGTDIIR